MTFWYHKIDNKDKITTVKKLKKWKSNKITKLTELKGTKEKVIIEKLPPWQKTKETKWQMERENIFKVSVPYLDTICRIP